MPKPMISEDDFKLQESLGKIKHVIIVMSGKGGVGKSTVSANIAITLIHQCDVLIRGLIEWKKNDFLQNGGIKEEMYRALKEWQQKNGMR